MKESEVKKMSSNLTLVTTQQGKVCPKCNKSKPFEEFSQNSALADGRACYCRKCYQEYHKDWVERHSTGRGSPERIGQLYEVYSATHPMVQDSPRSIGEITLNSMTKRFVQTRPEPPLILREVQVKPFRSRFPTQRPPPNHDKGGDLKEPEIKELMRPWMAQWGYIPEDRKLINRGSGLAVDDLFIYRGCFDKEYNKKWEESHQASIIPSPFETRSTSRAPLSIGLEYKASNLSLNEVQRAIGQCILYGAVLNLIIYLVIDQKTLWHFYDVHYSLPFGIIAYSDSGKEIAVVTNTKLAASDKLIRLEEEVVKGDLPDPYGLEEMLLVAHSTI